MRAGDPVNEAVWASADKARQLAGRADAARANFINKNILTSFCAICWQYGWAWFHKVRLKKLMNGIKYCTVTP